MSFRAAAIWSLFYVGAALAFGAALGLLAGWSLGTQFLAGYVVEKSLSVDNLFVFVIIMSTFAVPPSTSRARSRSASASRSCSARSSSRSAPRCSRRSRSCSWCSGSR